MGLKFPRKKDRSLGVSEKHTYDIPLDKGSGRIFLTALIGLMVFLMLLSVSAAYILNDFAKQWQTGLEGKWTIELPVIDENGEMLLEKDINQTVEKILSALKEFHSVEHVSRLSDKEISDLLSPWFETDNISNENGIILPVPVLISLDMRQTGARTAHDIRMELENIAPNARLDRHESWLEELLRLTGSLRLVAVLVTLVISAAGILAVAGAMQSRMAEHKDSVELLHLMGAEDTYICRQFQRHAFIISSQGAVIGLIICALFIYGLGLFLEGREETILPSFAPNLTFWAAFIAVPFVIVGLSVLSAKWAVLQRLQKML